MFKDNFCPSPWFHMRIDNAGYYEYCRWATKTDNAGKTHISEMTPLEFFQQQMQSVRENIICNNQLPSRCGDCHNMDLHNKVSGRQRQLLKIGVKLEQFEKTLSSSPWLQTVADKNFKQFPQDWQIDLGNYCNGACVFCNPESSSKLATEWKKIGFIKNITHKNWTDDPVLVNKLVDTLEKSPSIKYLHFIGGETLITPAFKTILQALIRNGTNKLATVGFTTNLVAWDDSVIELLKQFHSVHVGLSIESFSTVNDYVRWPAKISVVESTIKRWQELASSCNWLMQIRTTPTVLSVQHMTSVYDYAWEHNIPVESCNFLTNPAFMKPSVLPAEIKAKVIQHIEEWIEQHNINHESVINTRNPSVAKQQILQDLQSYISYLKKESDQSNLLPDLVNFLKKIDNSRGISVFNYLPEYEELFRTAGY